MSAVSVYDVLNIKIILFLQILDCNTCGLNDVMDTIREHASEQSIAVVGKLVFKYKTK